MIDYNVDFDPRLMNMGNDHAVNIAKPMEEIINLTGKNAIVTGGTTGLGYAVTNRLALAGAKVVIVGRSAEKGKIAESQFRERNLEVTYCQADITDAGECEKVVRTCEEVYGPVDILVNSAGRWTFHSFVDMEEEFFDMVMDLNVKGTYFMGKFAARSMIENRRIGKIVNFGSSAYIACDVENAGLMTSYEASKGAIYSLTMGMAKELKQYGINVNCIAPGSMDTYGNEYPGIGLDDYFEIDDFPALLGDTHKNTYTTPDDPALMVFTFCTDLCNWVYGETIKCAGGRHLNQQKIPLAVSMDLPEDYMSPRKLRTRGDGSAAYGKWEW
jgi:NAD(P)-dependent dehydrogenase (short-subunit alcohol dehydrogenase family)